MSETVNTEPEGKKMDYATYRELRRARRARAGWGLGLDGNPDLLFDKDGGVKLPKLVGIAISLAARDMTDRGQRGGCLTRQPTRERAEKVQAALAERLVAKGYGSEIRPGVESESYGVYLTVREHAGSVVKPASVDVSTLDLAERS